MVTVTLLRDGKPIEPDPLCGPVEAIEEPVLSPVLDPALCEHLRDAGRRMSMAAVTVMALAEEVDSALMQAHVRGAARFLVQGVRLFREAVLAAGYEVPGEERPSEQTITA